MTATCPKCSKALKVKDEWAGKSIKCPGCANTFRAGATGVATAAAAPPKHSSSAAAAAAKARAASRPVSQRGKESGFAINWGQIVLWAGLAMIPLAVLLVIFGPVRVKRHWDANQQKVEDDVRDVLDLALKADASQSGMWNPNKSGNSPSVTDLRMLPDIVTMSVPEKVRFDGITSNGKFEGTYAFESGEVEIDLKVGGITLPSGIHLDADTKEVTLPGGQRSTDSGAMPRKPGAGNSTMLRITGRVKNGPQAEVNGKKAEIYYPPATDEDGNPIPPEPKTGSRK